ncbi:hypothetical protein NPIL_688871 [Nephila pilipes]|uniref:Uncharacterized protein n=1 Tax=Nephila pilipes TaxID=299642 RepID=A0A8X6JW68_NEPPI|nr:hypothetical protein NPIL_688871 [Nephila pilipes]
MVLFMVVNLEQNPITGSLLILRMEKSFRLWFDGELRKHHNRPELKDGMVSFIMDGCHAGRPQREIDVSFVVFATSMPWSTRVIVMAS